MKTLIHVSICLAALWLASCAPPKAVPVPGYRPQAPVEKSESAQPYVDGLREAHSAADRAAAANQSRSETLSRESATLRDGISKATAEADRLRKQKAASEAELESLWSLLTAENQRAAELFLEAERTREGLMEERQLRLAATNQLDRLQKVVTDSATELSNVRLQLKDAEAGSKSANQDAARNFLAATKEATRADKAEGRISVWRNIAFGAIASAVILFLMLIYKP